MIIVSQDGKTMMNYDTAVALEVQHDDQYNDGFVIQGLYEDYCFTCGKYTTEERAKEVLEDIVKLYEQKDLTVGNMAYANVNYPKVYRMPEV